MQKLQLYNKANHGSFATILNPTYHWAGCVSENHCTHAAVSLISDAQWKHSSVEYEIVFHVRRCYSRTAVERALLPDDNTYSQEREQCHEIITKCRSYARLITHFLPCEVTCINNILPLAKLPVCPSRSHCCSSIITSVKIAFVSEKGA